MVISKEESLITTRIIIIKIILTIKDCIMKESSSLKTKTKIINLRGCTNQRDRRMSDKLIVIMSIYNVNVNI